MSITDFEDQVDHALWRGAWDAFQLHSAFGGTKKKDGTQLSPQDFFGWELAEIRSSLPEDAGDVESKQREMAEKKARIDAMHFEAIMRRDHPEMIVGEPTQPPAEPES